MQRWDRALLNATLLPRKTLEEMFSGWFVEPNGAIWHGGALEGYGTANVLVPASGHAMVLLGNTHPGERWRPWDVAREIYNEAKLGPPLSPFMPIVHTTVQK